MEIEYNSFNNVNDGIIVRTENIFEKQNMKLYNPTIMLSGHKGEIYSGKFSNQGFLYASGGYDRNLMVWEVFEESCKNLTTMHGHNNAILELVWSQDDSKIFTCSADKTVSVWDVYESKRLKKLKCHESFVNCLTATKKGPELVINL